MSSCMAMETWAGGQGAHTELSSMASGRDDHSEKIKAKWDKGEGHNLWGSLGPKSMGTVSGPDRSKVGGT